MSGMERKLIHIVEDDVAVSRLIEGTLQRFNYRSAVFRTGRNSCASSGSRRPPFASSIWVCQTWTGWNCCTRSGHAIVLAC